MLPMTQSTMQCDEAVEAVASLAAAHQPSDARQSVHVSTCLSCQAAVARDRRLVRDLQTLRLTRLSPRDGLLSNVIGAVDAEAAAIKNQRTRRYVYVGGAAATAGGVAIAFAARRARAS